MNFFEWLARERPDVRLLPEQRSWAEAMEVGREFFWQGGAASGKTFVFNLYREYLESRKVAHQ